MQYQISTAMAAFCRTMPLRQAMALIKNAGFDALDFPLSVYSDAPDGPMFRDDWRAWVREAAAASAELRLPILQAHAPWGQAIAADFHYERPEEIYFRAIEACAMLGCRHLIFHPLRQPDRVDTAAMRRRIEDYNVRWFYELVPTAERCGVVLNLENTFDSHRVQRPEDGPYPYTTAEDMLSLLRGIGSRQVALCLDTGHANISGQDIPAMVRAFRGELATVHLNDNYGRIAPIYEDLHLFPGYGRIDWHSVLHALRETGFSGTMNMEPVSELRRSSEAVRLLLLRTAGDVMRTLLQEAG